MPRKSIAKLAYERATTSYLGPKASPQPTLTDVSRPFTILCKGCHRVIGFSTELICTLDHGSVLVLNKGKHLLYHSPTGRMTGSPTLDKLHDKRVQCIECIADVGYCFMVYPGQPDLKLKVALWSEQIYIVHPEHPDKQFTQEEEEERYERYMEQRLASGQQGFQLVEREEVNGLPPQRQRPRGRPVKQIVEEQVDDSMEDEVEESLEEPVGGRSAEEQPAAELPTTLDMVKDIAHLKQFCLMLSDNQDSLTAKVNQLDQAATADNSIQELHAELGSLSSRLTTLESTLQTVVENQNQLMSQLKLQSKRSYSDFAVEIPVMRRNRSASPQKQEPQSLVDRQLLQQAAQNMSPPASMLSDEQSPIDEAVEDSTERSKQAEAGTAEAPTKSQPRQAELTTTRPSTSSSKKTGKTRQPVSISKGGVRKEGVDVNSSIVISDNEHDDDDDPESRDEVHERLESAAKRARLGQEMKKNTYRKRVSLKGSEVIGPDGQQQVLRVDRLDAIAYGEDTDGTAGRVTRSKRPS